MRSFPNDWYAHQASLLSTTSNPFRLLLCMVHHRSPSPSNWHQSHQRVETWCLHHGVETPMDFLIGLHSFAGHTWVLLLSCKPLILHSQEHKQPCLRLRRIRRSQHHTSLFVFLPGDFP